MGLHVLGVDLKARCYHGSGECGSEDSGDGGRIGWRMGVLLIGCLAYSGGLGAECIRSGFVFQRRGSFGRMADGTVGAGAVSRGRVLDGGPGSHAGCSVRYSVLTVDCMVGVVVTAPGCWWDLTALWLQTSAHRGIIGMVGPAVLISRFSGILISLLGFGGLGCRVGCGCPTSGIRPFRGYRSSALSICRRIRGAPSFWSGDVSVFWKWDFWGFRRFWELGRIRKGSSKMKADACGQPRCGVGRPK